MSDQPQQPMLPGMVSPAFAQRLFGSAPVPEVFANQMRMGVTITDFTLVFGAAVDIGGGTPMAIDKSVVHVAPGMLKQMLQNITMAVEAYEEVMGEIRLPAPLAGHLANLRIQLTTMLRQQMEGSPDPQA